MKPTKEQERRFWEWCGFEYLDEKEWGGRNIGYLRYIYPNGQKKCRLPNINLDNIFKHAVPLIMKESIKIRNLGGFMWEVEIDSTEHEYSLEKDTELKDALFWAIYKAAGLEE